MPYIVSGDDPEQVHRALAGALEAAYQQIILIQQEARLEGSGPRPAWPVDGCSRRGCTGCR